MGITVTLELPETVYHELELIAQETKRAVDDVLSEIIIRSFPSLYTDPAQDQMQREVDAFEAMHPELWKRYPNEYVAIYRGQVIDHSADERMVIDRIEALYPNKIIMIDKVSPQLQREIVFRSPRYVFNP